MEIHIKPTTNISQPTAKTKQNINLPKKTYGLNKNRLKYKNYNNVMVAHVNMKN